MNHNDTAIGMLDLMVRPGFCVKDNTIVKANQSAKSRLITEGTSVTDLITIGREEYADFQVGCLYLTLEISGEPCGASVTRMEDFDVFLLEEDADHKELQAMALAARELREPLTNVMTTADRLLPMLATQDDSSAQEQAARLNRGLFQILRVISNMSDADRYRTSSPLRQETRDLRAVMEEIFSRARDLVAHTGLTLTFTSLPEPVFALADSEQLERAVLNIISNAIKFTPKGGTIDARLTQKGKKLYLSVQDNGRGIPEEIRSTVHSRYLRHPGIEDSRFGIGLGMVFIRSAAASHGGTVLIDHPSETGTRITMTIGLRQKKPGTFSSNILRVDYAGERDHGLIELSDSLPADLYQAEKNN